MKYYAVPYKRMNQADKEVIARKRKQKEMEFKSKELIFTKQETLF